MPKSLRLIGLCLAVGLCGTGWADEAGDASRPAIVLRVGSVDADRRAVPSPAGHAGRTAKEVFWLSVTALMTFGIPLLDLPNVLARSPGDARDTGPCQDSWKAVLDGPTSWLNSANLRESVLDTVRADLTRLAPGRIDPMAIDLARRDEDALADAQAGARIGARLAAPSIFLVDVAVQVEVSPAACTARLRAQAQARVLRVGATSGDAAQGVAARVDLAGQSEAVDIHRWAADPEAGREALQLALRQLATKIVDAYPR